MKLNSNFGQFGGQYVPEEVKKALKELENAFEKYANTEEFKKEYKYYLKHYVGRPSPLYFAQRMTEKLGGAKIYLKREDLNHTGAHKINNVIGQVLLAKRMGKKKVIAETGAGQHGVATATCAALFNMKCTVYMGEESMKKQALNVFRMRLLGAEVVPVTYGSKSLKEAVDEAIKQWVINIDDTFYVLGSIVGPHPYPSMVREFQKIIGEEAKEQIMEQEGILPDTLIAAIGGGSNAMGLFNNFFHDEEVEIIGVEAAGKGADTDKHSLALKKGKAAAFHGMKTLFIQNEEGKVMDSYSVSAGLDYPGVGPQFAFLKETGRLKCVYINDDEAVEAFRYLSEVEGIIPALESSHAVAYAMKLAPTMDKDKIIIVNLSGRGDKDVHTVAKYIGEEI